MAPNDQLVPRKTEIQQGRKDTLELLGAQEYKASDLFKLAGLTYRQLHDWENRAGVMTPERATSEGWRRFTVEEVLALIICTTIRRQCALPLDRMRILFRWLMGKTRTAVQEIGAQIAAETIQNMKANEKFAALLRLEGNALRQAFMDKDMQYVYDKYVSMQLLLKSIRPIDHGLKMAQLGLPVYLVWLDEPMLMCEFEFEEAVAQRLFKKPTIVCMINDSFNSALIKLGLAPYELDRYSRPLSEHLAELGKRPVLSENERRVIHAIREREYQRITVHIQGGKIIKTINKRVSPPEKLAELENSMLDVVGRRGYQTITMIEQDGKLVHFSRETQEKLG